MTAKFNLDEEVTVSKLGNHHGMKGTIQTRSATANVLGYSLGFGKVEWKWVYKVILQSGTVLQFDESEIASATN